MLWHLENVLLVRYRTFNFVAITTSCFPNAQSHTLVSYIHTLDALVSTCWWIRCHSWLLLCLYLCFKVNINVQYIMLVKLIWDEIKESYMIIIMLIYHYCYCTNRMIILLLLSSFPCMLGIFEKLLFYFEQLISFAVKM